VQARCRLTGVGYGGPSNLSAEIARKALSSDEQSAQEYDSSEVRATLDKAELEELETQGAEPQVSQLSVGTTNERHRSPVPGNILLAAGFGFLAIAAILLTVLPQAT
jgi:hypothetical protein